VSFHPRTIRTALALGAALLLAACATPLPPESLVKAEEAYGAASSDPEVSKNAPVMLYEAKKDLDRAQQTWNADDEDPRVDHYAYVAHKRVEIAREVAATRVADAQAEMLTRERDQAVIEARSRQVDLARIASEQAKKREEEARLREEQAQARAADLEKQLAELQAKKTDRGMVITLGDVLFDFNRAELRSGAQQNLYRLVTFLRENAEREVLIEGHTDSVGSETYNQSLSERRAESVRGFLTQNGVDAGRTAVRGFGETRPVSSNETDAGRQQNRRVEVVILDPGKKASEEIGR
jgi:outer membrane protein OmpA-like peptidoglycan-associated protein